MNNNYKKLLVWEKTRNFVKNIYEISKRFPTDETYWLTSQIKRASVSIASNIAEWAWRSGNWEFKQFLYISKGSCYEVETQLIIALDLKFISQEKFDNLNLELQEIIKMIQWLINKL
jgi:four helix bundle protein